jgi:hypothetical protein
MAVYGHTPMRYFRRFYERFMPETILVIGHTPTYDEYGAEIYGDAFVVHTTKGAFRTATAQEVANHQRLEERVDGVVSLPVSAAPHLSETNHRLYRQDVGQTYEIRGVNRITPVHEKHIEVFVREADPERSYIP